MGFVHLNNICWIWPTAWSLTDSQSSIEEWHPGEVHLKSSKHGKCWGHLQVPLDCPGLVKPWPRSDKHRLPAHSLQIQEPAGAHDPGPHAVPVPRAASKPLKVLAAALLCEALWPSTTRGLLLQACQQRRVACKRMNCTVRMSLAAAAWPGKGYFDID